MKGDEVLFSVLIYCRGRDDDHGQRNLITFHYGRPSHGHIGPEKPGQITAPEPIWWSEDREKNERPMRLGESRIDSRHGSLPIDTGRLWWRGTDGSGGWHPDHVTAEHRASAHRVWRAECPVCRLAAKVRDDKLLPVLEVLRTGTTTRRVAELSVLALRTNLPKQRS